jgi:hypothetical protein
MKTNQGKAFILGAVSTVALGGCSITQDVRPVGANDIQEVCIQANPQVFMSEFKNELQRQIESLGIRVTRVYEGERPPSCTTRVEYTANWKWDLAMYLTYANLRVYQGSDRLIGEATYDAKMAGLNLGKFGTTAEKLRPLVNQLFAKAAAPRESLQAPTTTPTSVKSEEPTGADRISERLRTLDKLLKEGLITQQEYDRKKEELLKTL